jgi:hypothetical protein
MRIHANETARAPLDCLKWHIQFRFKER